MNNIELYDCVEVIEDYEYKCIPDGKILIKKGTIGVIVDKTNTQDFVMLELDNELYGEGNVITIPLKLLNPVKKH